MSKLTEKAMCKCTHTEKWDIKLKPAPRGEHESGLHLRYICTICGKEVSIKNISDEKIDEAIDVIDQVIDQIKLGLSENYQDDDGNIGITPLLTPN